MRRRFIEELDKYVDDWEGGIMPLFPEFDKMDASYFTDNTEYHRFFMDNLRTSKADLRYLIKRESGGRDIRGESKSEFEKRDVKDLAKLLSKIQVFNYLIRDGKPHRRSAFIKETKAEQKKKEKMEKPSRKKGGKGR